MKTMLAAVLMFALPFAASAGEPDRMVQQIKNEISAMNDIGPHNLLVYYRGGQVTLSGEVARPEDLRRIEDRVSRMPGVRQVNSQMQVAARGRFGGAPDDQEIAGEVRQVIESEGIAGQGGRTWVSSEVSGGRVTLEGNLQNRHAVDRLLAEVLMIPGVEDVDSRIQIHGREYTSPDYMAGLGGL